MKAFSEIERRWPEINKKFVRKLVLIVSKDGVEVNKRERLIWRKKKDQSLDWKVPATDSG